MKTILIVMLGIMLILGGVLFVNNQNNISEDNSEDKYLGPVPEGYDENYFRLTGETKKEGIVG